MAVIFTEYGKEKDNLFWILQQYIYILIKKLKYASTTHDETQTINRLKVKQGFTTQFNSSVICKLNTYLRRPL